VTAIPGPKSKALTTAKEKVVADALSLHVPVIIKEAHGALVTDADGNVFIDLAGGLGCLNVGHSHPKVVKAIQDAAANFTHTDFSVIPYESYITLSERLIALAPVKGPKKAAFFNSGAEAVENAVKMARKFTHKMGIIALEGAFHGRTNMAMSLTSKVKPYKSGFGPFAPEIYRVPAPYLYRRPDGMSERDYVKFCGDALEKALLTQVHPDDCAAIIFEPQQGEGGFIPLHPDYLARMQEIARKNNILLIADEIQSGYGRTGTFFACEQLGVEPDMILVGKSIAVGLPISGVIGRKDVLDSPPDSTIGGTYVGNPVACSAALAVLDVIEEEGLVKRAGELGKVIRERFATLAKKLEALPGSKLFIGDIRGLGAMVGAEFVKDLTAKEPAASEVNAIMAKGISRGVISVKCGIYGSVLRMLVPLVIPMDVLNEALDVLEQAALEVAQGK
ncbi:MAG: aspartate aminotransferase family protein, partial [Bacillota bacterium]